MGTTATYVGSTLVMAAAIGGFVSVVRLIVWLVGLIITIRGSRAQDRAEIIRAYSEPPETTTDSARRLLTRGQTEREGSRRSRQGRGRPGNGTRSPLERQSP